MTSLTRFFTDLEGVRTIANTELGSAYVAIMPSMKGFQKQVSSTVESTFGKVKSAVAGALATGAVAAFGKAALDSYAQFEQLVGGVDTLFKDASGEIKQYAKEAYKTANVSANSYMEQATAFSASLIQSLGGDTKKAAKYADLAIKDMSDNANKMGTSIDIIQQTYQSLMRGNYAMLDNLKLGYGGTKAELERLVEDASKLTGKALDPSKFSDIIEAIHAVQENIGITGTTAQEAATTIEGSVNTAKAAWQNWLTGLGDENADMRTLTDQLVESVIVAGENIIPRVGEIMVSLGTTVAEKAPEIASKFGMALIEALPPELSTAFKSAIQLWNMGDDLEEKFRLVFSYVKKVATDELTDLFAGIDIDFGDLTDTLSLVATGVAGVAGGFVALKGALAISDLIGSVRAGLELLPGVQTLVSNAQMILNGVMSANPFFLVVAVIGALVAAFMTLWTTNEGFRNAVMGIWNTIVSFFTVDVPNAINAALNWFGQMPGKVWGFLSDVIAKLGQWASETFNKAVEAGQKFLQGVTNGFNSAVEFVKGIPGKILSALGNIGSLLFDSGVSLLKGFANGIMSGVNTAIGAVKKGLGKIRSFFPFSPAKRGPFSGHGYTTYSGKALMGDFANAIRSQGGNLSSAVDSVLSKANMSLLGASDMSAGLDWSSSGTFGGASVADVAASGFNSGTVNNYYIDRVQLTAGDKAEAERVFGIISNWERLARA